MKKYLEHFDRPDAPKGASEYGYNIATVQTYQCNLPCYELEGHIWSFQVPDNRLGIRAVAAALGYGMSMAPKDIKGVYRELGMRPDRYSSTASFRQPVVLFARGTAGFRAIWGGMENSYYKEFRNEDGYDIIVYRLRTNLPDGGILVQSSTSAAYIMAEKRKHTWTLTLGMPMRKDGTVFGHKYHSVFRGAQKWYYSRLSQG